MALLGTLVALAGCGQEPTDGTMTTYAIPLGPANAGGNPDPDFDLDSFEWETITGTLSGGQSGGMAEELTSWDRYDDCWVALVVSEEAMPSQSINFTMQVPTYQDYEDNPGLEKWLIFRMGPSGTQFAADVQIMGTWMPWSHDTVPGATNVYNEGVLEEEDGVTVVYVPSEDRYRVLFYVDHFSGWETGPEPLPEGGDDDEEDPIPHEQ
ncbi:MAG: hypothetical protein DHS20C21_18570 [Gemmatimonadota bacterium]|nr:MAG: hypothetical protein DHS20C21_18570 [Gemmatimonadota bacterium]